MNAEANIPAIDRDDLRVEKVMAAAVQATACDDFGDLDFVEGLRIYLEDLRTHSGLTHRGIASQFQDVVRMLSNRLGYQRDLKRHPEILDEVIEKPIIILGLPRTGSSKLQRTIAADPGMQRLEVWRLLFPAPFPGSEGTRPDPRIAVAEQVEAMLKVEFPAMIAGHPMEAREPDEELWLLEMTFQSPMSSHKIYAPLHRAWTAQRSQRDAYAYMRKMLQYLQWQDGGARGRPWVMKSPMNIGEVATLLDLFPDATLVHCHRDPRVVIASYAALLEVTWLTAIEGVDLSALGDFVVTFWAEQVGRNLAARRELGENRIIDVYYDDIRVRPDAVIAAIYKVAGREITVQAAQAFCAYEARRPEGYFGKHRYELARFGLDNKKIETAFADYYARFPRLNDGGGSQ
jgi:hypothetical protein